MSLGFRIPRLPIADREAFLLDAVRGKKVLSIGLGGYSDIRSYSFNLKTQDLSRTLSGRLAAAAESATFLDLSQDAILAFKPTVSAAYYEQDVTADLGTWPEELRALEFDVIILGEVLEHLDNPGAALRNLSRLLTASGVLIVTVPNAFSMSGIVKMFMGVENTHPEHTCHYSYLTIQRLFSMSKMKLVHLQWYSWTKPRPANPLRAALQFLSHAISRLMPQLSHGIIVVASR
jgi:2-polyprenyl-3-methyl-5-hydroxy-6-metoxy-1,4-benzoquinol methylase